MKIIKLIPEVVTCECGRIEDIDKATIDENGNWTCSKCLNEEYKDGKKQ